MNYELGKKIMQTRLVLTALALALSATVRAGIYYSDNGSTGWVIPDGSTAGRTWQLESSGDWTITSVSVVFNIKDGFNGDLYGYLSYKDVDNTEKTLVLLNHIGGGSSAVSGKGFGTGEATVSYSDLLSKGVRLMDGGSGGNIHDVTPGVGNPVAFGNYAPDSGTVTFEDIFGGMKGSGTWTLFFADTSTGDQGKLMSWGLEVVPEPVNVALGIFGGVFGALFLVRSQPVRRRMQRWRAAAAAWMDAA